VDQVCVVPRLLTFYFPKVRRKGWIRGKSLGFYLTTLRYYFNQRIGEREGYSTGEWLELLLRIW
jgi:hypothetical protein